MKKLLVLVLILFLILFSCVVKRGYVIGKKLEPYREYTKIESEDFYKTEYILIPMNNNLQTGYKRVYDYTLYTEYFVKDFPDYILIIKSKKNNNITAWYVEKYIYDKLGIEHTYDQDIYRGSLTDFNNEYIFVKEWKE